MFPERPELPTLTREFQRLMSTGALPPDALDGLVPDDDASDGDTELAKPAADDEESMHLAMAESMYLAMARNLIGREAYKLRKGVDCADDDVDREDLAAAKALIDDEARALRALDDYASDDDDEDDQSNTDEEDCQSNADDEPAVSNAADLYAMYAAAFEEDDEEEAGKDYGRHWRLHPDYQSYPANEPEDEDDVGELPPDFLGPRVPSPRRSVDPEDMDELAGPSTTTNHARHVHYDDEDDVIVIKADQRYYASSSSSGSGSPSLTNSDRSSSPERFSDQDAQLARDAEQLAKAAERPCSPTPDADGIPHFASEDIDMNSKYTLGLQFKSDDEILAGFFGEGHGAVLSNIHPTPPPPPPPTTGQNAPPAPPPAPAPTEHMSIRPELAKRLEEVTRPRNLLHRTMNGDAYIPDGAGGFMSARTGRHVDQAFAGDFLQRQEANTLRNLAERINAGQVVVTIVDDQAASPASDDSNSQDAESVEEQLDTADSEEEVTQQVLDTPTPPTRERAREESVETEVNDEGDCSPSDEEVTQQVPDAPTPPTRKRAREVSVETELNDDDEDVAPSEKRRRVESEEQPGSHAVRSRAPSPSDSNDLGSSTTATQTELQLYTVAAAAPQADGPAVVEPTGRAANGSDETPVALTSVLPAAPPAQEAVPSERRSARIRVITETARVKAAEEARRAAEASPVPKPRGKGKVKGKGKGRK